LLCLAAPGGKLVARTMGKEGKGTAVVERKLIRGSCVNVACLPSKNVIHTAKAASLFGRHQEFGIQTGAIAVNMAGVYARKRSMVDEIVNVHLDRYHASGDELILGDGRFIGPRTIQVALPDRGERALTADRVFVNVEPHATIPKEPGLRDTMPMTHVEALNLQRVPEHLIVLGGGAGSRGTHGYGSGCNAGRTTVSDLKGRCFRSPNSDRRVEVFVRRRCPLARDDVEKHETASSRTRSAANYSTR
jgi:pyruvate/2-oxoglutarate dehydrogenase complex dihydrolipoamide dehydrogenase (E3) component